MAWLRARLRDGGVIKVLGLGLWKGDGGCGYQVVYTECRIPKLEPGKRGSWELKHGILEEDDWDIDDEKNKGEERPCASFFFISFGRGKRGGMARSFTFFSRRRDWLGANAALLLY